MEADDEIKDNKGSSYDFGARMYDPRVGKFFAVDPLALKFAHNGLYNFSENKVIDAIE